MITQANITKVVLFIFAASILLVIGTATLCCLVCWFVCNAAIVSLVIGITVSTWMLCAALLNTQSPTYEIAG